MVSELLNGSSNSSKHDRAVAILKCQEHAYLGMHPSRPDQALAATNKMLQHSARPQMMTKRCPKATETVPETLELRFSPDRNPRCSESGHRMPHAHVVHHLLAVKREKNQPTSGLSILAQRVYRSGRGKVPGCMSTALAKQHS